MIALLGLVTAVIAEETVVVQVVCEPAREPQWPATHTLISDSARERLRTLAENTKGTYASLFEQEELLARSHFRVCAAPHCESALQSYQLSLFASTVPPSDSKVNKTMFEPYEFCPRHNYLLARDNLGSSTHYTVMSGMSPIESEISSYVSTDPPNVQSLASLAEFVALGGRLPGLSEPAVQWLENFHSHFASNLMVGLADQGKMLTFELLSDIFTQIEEWTPLSVYFAPKTTYIALLKILTLFTAGVEWGDTLSLAVSQGRVGFFINGRAVINNYCGNPCELQTLLEKIRQKRMFSSREQFERACNYLGDEDLSWKKYYFLVGCFVFIVVVFKGSDWVVKKAAKQKED